MFTPKAIRRTLAALLVAFSLVAAGCGDDGADVRDLGEDSGSESGSSSGSGSGSGSGSSSEPADAEEDE